MARRRRNPSSSSGADLALIGVVALGAFLFLRKPATVNGLEDGRGVEGLGFSIGKSFKKAVKAVKTTAKVAVAPMVMPTKLVMKAAKPITKIVAKSPVAKLVAKTPIGKVIAKVVPGAKPAARKQQQAVLTASAAAGAAIIYQDANGVEITRAQYESQQAEYDRMYAQQQANDSQPVQTQYSTGAGQSFTDPSTAMSQAQIDSTNQQYAQQFGPSGGGGGGGADPSASDYYAPPAQTASASAEVMPTAADEATPAPKKMNPLVTIGAFAAIPVIFGLVGDHK